MCGNGGGRRRDVRRTPRSASRIASCQTVPSRERRGKTRGRGERVSRGRVIPGHVATSLARIPPRGLSRRKERERVAPTILRDRYDFSVRARATPSLAVSPSILPPPRELAHRQPHVHSEVAAACAPAR